MANSNAEQILATLSDLKLGSSGDDMERAERFWNGASVAMKFFVERLWLDAVWKCQAKPNYGMRDLDPILEERASNKFKLTEPLIDGYLRELGKAMFAKLGRSRKTGLMPPVKLFVPYTIFRHLCNVARGYGGSFKSSKSSLSTTVDSYQTAAKVFSPVRCNGSNFLKKRHFDKVNENGRNMLKYAGRAAVVVGNSTPLIFDYNMKQEKLTLTFYVQHYNRDDFSLDLRLQGLINQEE